MAACMSHVNSYARESLSWAAPIDLAEHSCPELLAGLGIEGPAFTARPANSQGRAEFSGAAACRFPGWNRAGRLAADFAPKNSVTYMMGINHMCLCAHMFTYSGLHNPYYG